ncbi:MHYT domain-containing protein [Lacimicrobium alkaliphilum]|uniref:histidine kinase n=1 Tax=Lacimicrobium alkaliphilum TaxID=1526571 RepID=A0ABQ1RKR9_9ALTE|nr:MHYT domain-containing protein [Lacimicrobium alkaliphilum]GGD70177.1 hypothetical protein GCM10011357_26520 [Lacimicrobium alkaliphilum]
MFDWILRQFSIPQDSILLYGDYNLWLVILSVLIAVFASFMGLQVMSQAAVSGSPRRRQIMLLVGGIALGGGIWSMHFIGMLAFELCTQVEYGWLLTLLSLLPGICASWIALNHINRHRQSFVSLLIAGVLVGAGIGTMHYTGMAAMQMAPLLRYDPWMFSLSIVVAVTLAMLSLWVRSGLHRVWKSGYRPWHANVVASVVMGCAIAGMHYTGMAAARFVRPPGMELSEQPAEISIYLALGVAAVTVVIIFLVLGINLIFRYKDISQRASESERRLLATMDTAVDGIVTIDSHGVITSVNRAVQQLLGWSAAELVGNNVSMLTPEPVRSEHDSYLQRYLDTGEARIIGQGREVQAVHKNGERIDIRLAIGHVRMANDDFFVGFISDIRQRLKMEQSLRENEEKFRSFITNIPGIAYRCESTPEWPMVFISDGVEGITGYPPEDFVLPDPKRSFADLIHPEDRKRAEVEASAEGAFNIEYRLIRRDGEIRWLMEQGVTLKDRQSGTTWLDGFIMDITERREMEQALREAKEKAEQAASARAAFMANMSHEIRTPMNAIIGFSDILLESSLEDEQLRHLKTINQSARSLLHLLNDVLDSAKLDKGKLELEVRDFSLIQEVDAVISTLWLQARKKGLELNADISPKLQTSYSGSPERIRQVLTNLISNAVKFTQQGHVRVSVKPLAAEQIEFLIEDTGIGMTPSQLQAVFEPFTQADASMSRRFGGTGLGTTISKQLVELMGGEISAQSESGKGSQFRFVLPLKPGQDKETEQQQQIRLPALTILVVDDIQQNIELLTLLLQRQGHKVLSARDGKQALIRMQAEQQIDLVLMDVQMPVMDGLAAARQRRQTEQQQGLKPVPIIALTASVLEDDRKAAKQAGMDGFANKPVDMQLLSVEIARVLGLAQGGSNVAVVQEECSGKLIDEKKGIALWGSKEDYYRQLKAFVKEQESAFKQLAHSCENQDWQDLKQTAHKLKGICGNLSLTSLMRSLEKLEAVLNSHPQQCDSLVPPALTLFDQIRQAIRSDKDAERKQKATQSADPAVLIGMLQKLRQAASQNEIDETALDELMSHSLTGHASEINAIYRALNDFEFAQAIQSIDSLIQELTQR